MNKREMKYIADQVNEIEKEYKEIERRILEKAEKGEYWLEYNTLPEKVKPLADLLEAKHFSVSVSQTNNVKGHLTFETGKMIISWK